MTGWSDWGGEGEDPEPLWGAWLPPERLAAVLLVIGLIVSLLAGR